MATEIVPELKLLINSRKYTRKLVTEIFNRRNTFSALDHNAKDILKAELNDHLVTLKDYNKNIQKLKCVSEVDETWLSEELKNCESYFVKLRECVSSLGSSSPSQDSSLESARSLLKSPTAPLPKFQSKDDEDLLKFFKEFEDVISKFNYSDYDKFILLKQQISGRALLLINSLESDKRGYIHAKDLLTTALASKDNQTFNIIKQLSEMNMSYDSDSFEYISKMKNIMETVKRLQLNVDSFLRYFFWHGLNESFKNHLTLITNSSRPSLSQINDNFFEAAERYQNSQKKFKKKRNFNNNKDSKIVPKTVSTVLASDVNVKSDKFSFKPCSICSQLESKEADHPLHQCTKFKDSQSKLEQLKKLKGCVKCGNLNHNASQGKD